MLMRDVEIGATVFLDEDMSDGKSNYERRETYYRRNSPTTYLRLGLIQGDPELATPRFNEEGQQERPRYMRFFPYEYPLVAALPVKPLTESKFWQYASNEQGRA